MDLESSGKDRRRAAREGGKKSVEVGKGRKDRGYGRKRKEREGRALH